MSEIAKLIRKNKPLFDIWKKQFDEHLLQQFEPDSVATEGDDKRIFFQTNDLLMDIAENFFVYGKFRDNWDTSKCSLVLYGQYILLRSKKMDVTFYWGIEGSDFFLETSIWYAENIRFMTDEFWETLLELKTLGRFEYSGGGGLDAEHKPYFENKTSTIFQVIRTFMFNQIDRMDNKNTQREFGTLQVKWEMGGDWANLIERSCKAFRFMYRLNYQLWKIHDLNRKRQ